MSGRTVDEVIAAPERVWQAFTIETVPARVHARPDPWARMAKTAAPLPG